MNPRKNPYSPSDRTALRRKWSRMTTGELRCEIQRSLQELYQAFQDRTIFEEIHIYNQYATCEVSQMSRQVLKQDHFHNWKDDEFDQDNKERKGKNGSGKKAHRRETVKSSSQPTQQVTPKGNIKNVGASLDDLPRRNITTTPTINSSSPLLVASPQKSNPPTSTTDSHRKVLFQESTGPKKDVGGLSQNPTPHYPPKPQPTPTPNHVSSSSSSSSSLPTYLPTTKTWGWMLNDLAYLAPFMTLQEYELTCHIVSLCLLSYFVPHYSPIPFPSYPSMNSKQSQQQQQQPQQQSQPGKKRKKEGEEVEERRHTTSSSLPPSNTHTKGKSRVPTKSSPESTTCQIPTFLSEQILSISKVPFEQILERLLALIPSISTEDTTEKNDLNTSFTLPQFAPLNDDFFASFVHFLHDGLAPWLHGRSLFPCWNRSSNHPTNVTTNTKEKENSLNLPSCMASSCTGKDPIYYGSTDLLHLLALAIAPYPLVVPKTIDNNNQGKSKLFSSSARVTTLISCFDSLSPDIFYIQRVEMVHILSKYLQLPTFSQYENAYFSLVSEEKEEDSFTHTMKDSPSNMMNNSVNHRPVHQQSIEVFRGRMDSIQHLRWALESFDVFSYTTMAASYLHSYYAKQTCVNIAIDTGIHAWIYDEVNKIFDCLQNTTNETKRNETASAVAKKRRYIMSHCSTRDIGVENHQSEDLDRLGQTCNKELIERKKNISDLKKQFMGQISPLELVFNDNTKDDIEVKQSYVKNKRYIYSRLSKTTWKRKRMNYLQEWTCLNQTSCLYCKIGFLLQDLILRVSRNRHDADDKFTEFVHTKSTSFLKDYLKQQGTTSTINESKEKKMISSCQVAAVLVGASKLCYFLGDRHGKVGNKLTQNFQRGKTDEVDKERDVHVLKAEDIEMSSSDALIDSSLELLHSSDLFLASAASSLVSSILLYSVNCKITNPLQRILSAVKRSLQNIQIQSYVSDGGKSEKTNFVIEDILIIASRQDYCFAVEIITFIVNTIQTLHSNDPLNSNDEEQDDRRNKLISFYRLLSRVSLSNPPAILKNSQDILTLTPALPECTKYFIASLLCYQLSCTKAQGTSSLELISSRLHLLLHEISNPWDIYLLAKHALCTSNFDAADILYRKAMRYPSSIHGYMWLNVLSKMSEAENVLSRNKALGLPDAIQKLLSAMESLRSLSVTTKDGLLQHRNYMPPFSFQLAFLCFKRDFWNLLAVTRGLCAEMSLTNHAPAAGTRPLLHQKNIPMCFYTLTSRIHSISREYGAFFGQQTRSVLRSLFAICRFIGVATGKAFAEGWQGCNAYPKYQQYLDEEISWPRGDVNYEMIDIIKKASLTLSLSKSELIDPMVRASGIIRMIDKILLLPLPYPTGFLTIKSVPLTYVRISAHPELILMDDVIQSDAALADDDELEVVDVSLGSPFEFLVEGLFSNEYLQLSDLYFSQAIIWYSMTYETSLLHDKDGCEDAFQININDSFISEQGDVNVKLKIDSQDPLTSVPLHPGSWFDKVSSSYVYGAKFSTSICMNPISREGYYKMDTRIGYRDVRFGDYEARTHPFSSQLFLRVTVDEQ